MRNKIFFIALILNIVFANYIAISAPVSLDKAKDVAVNFYNLQYYRVNGTLPYYKAITINPVSAKSSVGYWVCNFSNGGYVIISGDDIAYPVIGYSFESEFDLNNIPEALQDWLTSASESIDLAKSNKANTGYQYLWEKYLNKTEINNMQKQSIQNVSPFVTTKWDQGVNYNNYCPANVNGPGGHCLTGCVATAMAQVMKYYNYPERGRDSILYTGNNNVVFENTYYRWNEMTTYANSTSGDAISELMFHCGITVNMNYGPDGSGTMTEYVPWALIHNFRYHPSAGYLQRKNVTDKDWDIIIRDNLDMLHPVLYSGQGTGGHAFVCDGYQDTCYYHFNWGWSGAANGYFYNNDLTPYSDNFSNDQGAVINIKPYHAAVCYSGKVLTDRSRTFNDGSDYSYYWNNTDCNWLIAPDSAETIRLTFTSFDTQANADFVSVYDGADTTATLIGKYSGSQIPPVINSSGSKLYIVLKTNDTIQGQGFDAYYETKIIGVEETLLSRFLSFYPNPATDVLFVKLNDIHNWDGEIEIYNITGSLVKKCNIKLSSENSASINVSELKQGFYIIKAKGNEGEFSTKLLIK
ncbi:MAG: C10 family peptidase [Bacteroidia bacterium]|nr:C10 family peptidase [Bacteroidia bacterium]